MATKTQLQPTALPGKRRSFLAKTEASIIVTVLYNWIAKTKTFNWTAKDKTFNWTAKTGP